MIAESSKLASIITRLLLHFLCVSINDDHEAQGSRKKGGMNRSHTVIKGMSAERTTGLCTHEMLFGNECKSDMMV